MCLKYVFHRFINIIRFSKSLLYRFYLISNFFIVQDASQQCLQHLSTVALLFGI